MLQLPGLLVVLYERIKTFSSKWGVIKSNNAVEGNLPNNLNTRVVDYELGPQRKESYLTLQRNMNDMQVQIENLKSMFDQRISDIERSANPIEG